MWVVPAIGYLLTVLGLLIAVVGLIWIVLRMVEATDEGPVPGILGATVIGVALSVLGLWMCCL